MTALYIIGGILLFFILLGFLKITVRVIFDGEAEVFLRIAFIRIKMYPQKEEPEKKEKEPAARKKKKKKVKERKKQPPLGEVISLASELFAELFKKFGKYLRIEEYRLKILVATDDPAKTGIMYGTVSAAAGMLYAFINNYRRRTLKKGKITSTVEADFLAEEYELSIRAALSMRLWQLLSVSVTAGTGLLKYIKLNKKDEAKERTENK